MTRDLRNLAWAVFCLACGIAAWAAESPSVVITYEGELTDFPRYWSGDRYVVEIPQANASRLIRGDLSVSDRKDGATVWSFPHPAGTQATLRNSPGRIEIIFAAGTASPAATAPAPRLSLAPSILLTPAPSPFSSKEMLPEIAEPPSGMGRELTSASLADRSISMASFALDVPDSPAFAVLGLTPETAVRPSNPQELVTSVLNGLDQRGNFQTGLALDTAPYLLFFGKDVTLERYQRSYITRFLSRAQLSIASTKGTEEEDKSTKLAMGLHLTLLDRGDPRFDLDLQGTYASIDDEVRRMRGPIPPGADMQALAARDEERMRPLFKAAFAEARRRNWNRTNWSLGAAPSWIKPDDGEGDFRWNGGSAWTSFAYGFEGVPALEKSSQLILHARYRNHEEVPDPLEEGQFTRQNSLLLGGRLRIGTVDTNASLDAAYIREWQGSRDRNAYRVSVGLERRMTRNLWLSLSFGKEFGDEDGQDPLLILGGFKLGFGDEPAPVSTVAASATPAVFRPESDIVPATAEESPSESGFVPSGGGAPPKAPRPDPDDTTRRATFPPDPSVPPKAPRPATPQNTRAAGFQTGGSVPPKADRPASSGATRRTTFAPSEPPKAPRPDSTGNRRAAQPTPAATSTVPGKAERPVASPSNSRAAQPRDSGAVPPKAVRPETGSGTRGARPPEN